MLDDGTPQTAVGPVCVNSQTLATPILSKNGSVLLSFRIQTGSTDDKIAIRAVGLLVE